MNNYSRFFLSISILLIFSFRSYSQPGVNYNDVAVIVNMNSDSSQVIANYFMEKRNIPEVNLIPVYTSTDEEINDSLFQDYASQIRTYISNNNLSASLNYLVTTKGCPLKILSDLDDSLGCNACVESELMLLPPQDSSHMDKCLAYKDITFDLNFFTNPYYYETNNFHTANYGIYLVTRLDGYTVKDVLNLIDRSGPNTYVQQDSVQFVLDQSPNFSSNPINDAMVAATVTLYDRGWAVNLNEDTLYVTHQSNVLGYMSWGSNDGYSHHDVTHSIPHNKWVKGSIAETGVSTSGRSFQPGTIYGQSLIADLIHEGATGAKGYVYEPIDIAIASPSILFDRYTDFNSDGLSKYNLAESYYSASHMIGWMDVVIGDPKTSITINPAYASAVKVNDNLSLRIFPNPASDFIFIESKIKNPEAVSMSLYDLMGKQVWNESADSSCFLNKEINVSSLPSGIYNFQLRTNNQIVSMKIAIIR